MPDTGITRAEMSERARSLLVRSYDVDIDLTGGPDTFESVSLIRLDCRGPGSTTHADLIAADVDYHVVTASHPTPGGQQIPLELTCRAG